MEELKPFAFKFTELSLRTK